MKKSKKLVRDNIPQIIEKANAIAEIYICDNQEYALRLKEKLQEETQEFLDEESIEELADILEVIYAIANYKNVSKDTLESIRAKKAKERGAFDKKIVLVNIHKKQ